MQNQIKQILESLQAEHSLSDAVSGIVVRENNVGFVIEVSKFSSAEEAQNFRKLCESKIANLAGVGKVTAVLTGDFAEQKSGVRVEAKSAPKGGVQPPTPKPIEGVKKIIAVASGKGGVGKSTIAASVAVSLAKTGLKVGLVDADIYGPSIAKIMFNSVNGLRSKVYGEEENSVNRQPSTVNAESINPPEVVGNKMIPPVSHGVKVMSMGLILGENTPVVWRGPMISKALSQLMLGAEWGALDVLVIDMPPGTGDIQISMAQNFKIDGVIMVSTPHALSILDVRKALTMFEKLGVKVLGVIENMSYFKDPETGKKHHIFGEANLKKELGAELLCQIPISANTSQTNLIDFDGERVSEWVG
jgi:ATP-binding protein involved in chromosome partitioning